MNTKNLKKSLTLIELLLASAFLIVVVAGSTALFNFAMREAVLLTRRSIALEDPAVFTLQHIQRRVFPSQGIDLVGTITNNTSTAIDVIADRNANTGVRYELDAVSHQILYYRNKNNITNPEVLARNISQFSFQNAETPAEHSNFRLLGLRITGHDYDRAEIKDFTLQTRVLARCAAPSTILPPLLVYNATQNILYSDIQTAVNAANPGEEIWLNGFDFPNNSFVNDPNRDDSVFELLTPVTVNKPLTIRGGYQFVYNGNPSPIPSDPNLVTLDENLTGQTWNADGDGNPRTGYPTTLQNNGFVLTHADNGAIYEGMIFTNVGIAVSINQSSSAPGNYLNISFCSFIDVNSGIVGNSNNEVSVENCYFHRIRIYPISTSSQNTPFHISRCHFYESPWIDPNENGFFSTALLLSPGSTVMDCTFENNATKWNGLIMVHSPGANIQITRCTFSGIHPHDPMYNRYGSFLADYSGGMAGITFSSCQFINFNYWTYAYQRPLPVFNISWNMQIRFENCTFRGITSDRAGLFQVSRNANVNLSYCLFDSNSVLGMEELFIGEGGQLLMDHCVLYNNTVPAGYSLIRYNHGSALVILDSILWNNSILVPELNGHGSLATAYSSFTTTDPQPGNNNIIGNPQFVNPATGDFHLQYNPLDPLTYPCVDHRPLPPDPNASNDRDTTPADGLPDCGAGTLAGDMGIYGGPGACGW